jgi:hypothetical protein
MKKLNEKKLSLASQTIVVLSEIKLVDAAGGRMPVTKSCAAECGSRRCD